MYIYRYIYDLKKKCRGGHARENWTMAPGSGPQAPSPVRGGPSQAGEARREGPYKTRTIAHKAFWIKDRPGGETQNNTDMDQIIHAWALLKTFMDRTGQSFKARGLKFCMHIGL